jgi:hypothetical protein
MLEKKGYCMKKMLTILTVLALVVPAMAATTVTVSVVDEGSGIAAITYASDDANLPRAFGLDISLDYDNSGTIVVTDLSTDYNVAPGTFDAGPPVVWGDPVVDADTNSLTLEMGSLYEEGVGTPPPTSGTLCKFEVDGNPGGCVTVTIAENAARAPEGVVLEDLGEIDVVYVSECVVVGGVQNTCYEGQADDAEWELVLRPECWCWVRQCNGDADDAAQTKSNYFVFTDDLDVLVAGWGQAGNNPKHGDTITVTSSGRTVDKVCADFDHLAQTKSNFRVFTDDLDILVANWGQANKPDPNCVPGNESYPDPN